MQPDQLTQILQLIREAGAGTKDVAIIYLLITLLKPLLGWVALVIIVSQVTRLIQRCVVKTHICTKAWLSIGEAARLLYISDEPSTREVAKVVALVEAGLKTKQLEKTKPQEPQITH